ncbi:MAG: hypothetical protein U0Q11_26970 [Vicinamibacterales bacterium]
MADRSVKRIQLFDQDGRFLTEWKQFGEASGLFIKPDDTLYVTDWQEQKKTILPAVRRTDRFANASLPHAC